MINPVFGYIVIMAVLGIFTMPYFVCAEQASSIGDKTGDVESLSELVTDPLSHLTQVQLKDIYTPAEYGTNAPPNTVQMRPIFAIHPFSLIPVEQLVRPTIKIVTIANGSGASTTTSRSSIGPKDDGPRANFTKGGSGGYSGMRPVTEQCSVKKAFSASAVILREPLV
jgi:hypothetical protein